MFDSSTLKQTSVNTSIQPPSKHSYSINREISPNAQFVNMVPGKQGEPMFANSSLGSYGDQEMSVFTEMPSHKIEEFMAHHKSVGLSFQPNFSHQKIKTKTKAPVFTVGTEPQYMADGGTGSGNANKTFNRKAQAH